MLEMADIKNAFHQCQAWEKLVANCIVSGPPNPARLGKISSLDRKTVIKLKKNKIRIGHKIYIVLCFTSRNTLFFSLFFRFCVSNVFPFAGQVKN
jgi:hypothetical protein